MDNDYCDKIVKENGVNFFFNGYKWDIEDNGTIIGLDAEDLVSSMKEIMKNEYCRGQNDANKENVLSSEIESSIQFVKPAGTSTNPFYGVVVNGVGANIGYDVKSARRFYNAVKKAISDAVKAERKKWKERWNDSI